MNSFEYIQIVNKPTFISAGSLLDQVYVKQSLYDKIQNELVSVYYSDHDCVKIVIKQWSKLHYYMQKTAVSANLSNYNIQWFSLICESKCTYN